MPKIREIEKYNNKMAKGKRYHELKKRVEFYYHETSSSMSQIARHFDVSAHHITKMLDGKYPKYYKEYLDEVSRKAVLKK